MKQKQNDRTVTKENGQAAQPKRRADMPLFLGNAKDAANRQNAAKKAQVRREGAAAERAEARSAGREEKREQKQPFAPNGKQKKF